MADANDKWSDPHDDPATFPDLPLGLEPAQSPSSDAQWGSEISPAAAAPALGSRGPVPVLPLAGSGPRFCSACGAIWQSHWDNCASCAARLEHAAASAQLREPTSIAPALWLYFALLAASIFGVALATSGHGGATTILGLGAVQSVIVLIWWIALRREINPALVKRVHPLWFTAAIGGAVVTFMAATGAIQFLHRFIGLDELIVSPLFLREGYGWGIIVLAICVQPAIFEEIGFRGVVFSALRRTMSPAETIFLSALMFMVLHLSVASFPHLLLLGLALGYLRWRTGSLLPGMVLHFTHNLLCIAAEGKFRF